jgi:hypothetical protein
MTCTSCGAKMSAGNESSPGGKASPGVFLTVGLVSFAGSGACFALQTKPEHVAYGVIAGLVAVIALVQVPIAIGDSRSMSATGLGYPAKTCPACGAPNRIRPWSF